MKVVFQSHSTIFSVLGRDSVKASKMAASKPTLCVLGRISTDFEPFLEVGALRCNLVAAEKGDTRNGIDDNLGCCTSESTSWIRSAVATSLAASGIPQLQARIRPDYTWAESANSTLIG